MKILNKTRRSNKQRGFIRFPIGDPRYQNTNEGGMFVRLVVIEGNRWTKCSGGLNSFVADKEFIRDNRRPVPRKQDYGTTLSEIQREQSDYQKYENFHFPAINKVENLAVGASKYLSRPYLAVYLLVCYHAPPFSGRKGICCAN